MDTTDVKNISDILGEALRNHIIETAVLCVEGCGTSVVSDPSLVIEINDKITGSDKTEPDADMISKIGDDNILDPEIAKMDNIEGVCVAYDAGIHRVAVTTGSVKDAQIMRDMFGSDLYIIGLFNSLDDDESEKAHSLIDILIVGGKIEFVTEFGKGILADSL